MPLVYTGRLEHAALTPEAALARHRHRFERGSTPGRLDVFLACDRLRALDPLAARLPSDFDGFWMDVAGRARPADLPRYLEWARTLRGGTLRLRCLEPSRESEVVVGLSPPTLQPVDDEALDPFRPGRPTPRAWIGYFEPSLQTRGRPERRALAAARVRQAYRWLDAVLGGGLPPFEDWLAAQSGRQRSNDAEALVFDEAWRPSGDDPVAAPAPPPAAAVDVRSLELDGVPITLRVEVPCEHRAWLVRVLGAWVGLLDEVDTFELRCMDRREALAAVAAAVEPGERTRGTLDAFGVATAHRERGLAPEVAEALFAEEEVAGGLLAWGLRWSALGWPLPAPVRAFYWCRGERRQFDDCLRVELADDDPDDPRVEAARRALGERLHPALARAGAWQFEPAADDGEVGRGYARLVAGLGEVVARVAAESPPLPPPRARHGRGVRGWLERAFGGDEHGLREAFPEGARRAVDDALPGFRHDRTAHPTEAYFLDFVRATAHGFNYLQLVRTQPGPGHRVRLGVSLFRARLDELDAGPGRVAHGLVFDLDALYPERAPLAWSYRRPRAMEAALAETLAVVRARALPCFERAEAVLAAARATLPRFGGDDGSPSA